MMVTPAAVLTGLLSAMPDAEGAASPGEAVGVLALSLLATTVVAVLKRRRSHRDPAPQPHPVPALERSRHACPPAVFVGNGVASG